MKIDNWKQKQGPTHEEVSIELGGLPYRVIRSVTPRGIVLAHPVDEYLFGYGKDDAEAVADLLRRYVEQRKIEAVAV